MTIFEKIELYKTQKNYCKITRQVDQKSKRLSHGYIVDYSYNFVLIIETHDFKFEGYSVFPISSIVKIRFNEYDQYFDYIMEAERQKELIKIDYSIDLSDWKSIFKTVKKTKLICTIEQEGRKKPLFLIGPIEEVKNKKTLIHNFDPLGFLDKEATEIRFKDISIIKFDDPYGNTFAKYLRNKS
ncbi:hypothetical protein [Pedobacter nototheniae]|uniref:hypothetical protein n=1 Tax=Pedobacter nototheniae TaxID=2488994 RepID=UPI00292FE717|nr:hypothetical protein [Pedobacter nototheniae]